MSDSIDPKDPSGGNTKTPLLDTLNAMEDIEENENRSKKAKVTQCAPAKKWTFTWNNYTEEEFLDIKKTWTKQCDYIIIGKEVGEQGTPHLQGYLELISKKRPMGTFGTTRVHWEKAKGNRMQNKAYCSKDGNFHEFDRQADEPIIWPEKWRDWQQALIEKLAEKPDDRTILWYFDPKGGAGKTTICKYICREMGGIILSGKIDNIKNGIVQYKDSNKKLPKIILINYTRSEEGFMSYAGLETVKDMCFYSGKYEGGMIVGNCPHVICFANFYPDKDKLTGDRWVVIEM